MTNLLDLPLDQFRGYLAEGNYPQARQDELMRAYRAQNSLSGLLDRYGEEGLEGKNVSTFFPVAGPSGMSIFDALKSGQLQTRFKDYASDALGGVLGALENPRAAYQGTLPQADYDSAAMGTGGLAMGGGGVVAGRLPDGAVAANNISELRRLANIQRFGHDPEEQPAPTSGGFDAYLSTVNPSGKRIQSENRPNLRMGDMYGMLPKSAQKVSSVGDVDIMRDGDDFYAVAYNPDVGEMDVVGYAQRGEGETDLMVVQEMQGKGVGGELQYQYRSANPTAPTGGLTEAGEGLLRNTYGRLRDDGTVNANASKSAGLLAAGLPDPRNAGEAMAQRILEMRAAGKAGDVTDEMMAQADPQYMFNNTPLDMSEAARMARAEDAGFDVDLPLYHGTDKDFQEFNPRAFGLKDPGWYGRGVYSDTDTEVAGGYANYDELDIGQNIMPIFARGRYMDWPDANQPFSNRRSSIEGTNEISSLGYDGVRISNDRDFYGDNPDLQTEQVTFNPANIRSRFARFDPEFSHLSNLSAANASKSAGLLAAGLPEPSKAQNAASKLSEQFGVNFDVSNHPTSYGNSTYVSGRIAGPDGTYTDVGFRLSDHETGDKRKATDDFLTIIDGDDVSAESLVAEVQSQFDKALPKMQKMSDGRKTKAMAQADALSRWSELSGDERGEIAVKFKEIRPGYANGVPWKNLTKQQRADFAAREGLLAASLPNLTQKGLLQ